MRTRLLLASTVTTLAVVLSACSGNTDTSSLEVPNMPSTSSETSIQSTPGEATLDPALIPDENATSEATDPDAYTNPLTGETTTGGTDQGVQDFTGEAGKPAIQNNAVVDLLLDETGVSNNTQATVAVGDFSSADVQNAWNTVLGFLLTGARSSAITSPGPNGFTNENAMRTAMQNSLELWMSPPALQSVINQAVTLSKVPVVDRTNAQQSFYVLFPTALCQQVNESCLLTEGTQYTKPTVRSWTSGSGLAGLEFTNQQYYTAIVPTFTDGQESGIQKLAISFTLKVQMLPGSAGGWHVVGISASDAGFKLLGFEVKS